MRSGSCGASSGASTAAAPSTTTSARPKSALPLRRNMRTASARLDRPRAAAPGVSVVPAPLTRIALLIADARIEDRVEQIDDQVHHHEGGGDQQHPALHQRVV